MMPAVGALGPNLPYFLDQGMHRTATKRFAQPEKIANCITFLSSYMSSFMSGEAILGDGYAPWTLQIWRAIGPTIIISRAPSLCVIHIGKFRCFKTDNFVGRPLLAKSQSFRKVTHILFCKALLYLFGLFTPVNKLACVDQFEQVSYDIMCEVSIVARNVWSL